jgi:hypothetical protein
MTNLSEKGLIVVESKQDYLSRLQKTVQQLHGCAAVHSDTVTVHEIFQDQTLWHGEVEIFNLTGHPKAKKAYGWSRRDGVQDQTERLVTVLELAPVVSPVTAVRASIMADKRPGPS